MKTIAIIGPLDTKGPENQYLKQRIEALGCRTAMIDIRTVGEAYFSADYTPQQVAAAAGTTLEALLAHGDRLACVNTMGAGAAELVHRLYLEGRIHGAIAMGGAQTTSMGAMVMRRLPIGFPKVLVSTIATSAPDQVMLAGINDTMVINSLVDVGGMNPILAMIIDHAAAAICGMALALKDEDVPRLSLEGEKPCIGISMWGVTTQCVLRVAERLNEVGCQTLIFHATGIGGHTMERLIGQSVISGVIEITLAEFSNPLCGGEYAFDPLRLSTAAQRGIPQIIVPGGVDMVKHMTENGFVPEVYQSTQHYLHNPSLLFTRSSTADNRRIGQALAEKLNTAVGSVEVLFPCRGLSAYDIEGGPLYAPESDRALADTLRTALREDIPFHELPYHINDAAFADIVAQHMLRLLEI